MCEAKRIAAPEEVGEIEQSYTGQFLKRMYLEDAARDNAQVVNEAVAR